MQDCLTRTVVRVVVLAAVASAIGVPAAQARPAPDDLGGGAPASVKTTLSSKSGLADQQRLHAYWKAIQAAYVKQYGLAKPRPVYGIGDNMSLYGNRITKAAKVVKAVRPDDRAGIRGIGAVATNDFSDVFSRAVARATQLRLNDRAQAGFMRWNKRIVLG